MIVSRVALGRLRLLRNAFAGRGSAARGLRHPAVALVIVAAMGAVAFAGFRALLEALLLAGAGREACVGALGLALAAAFAGLLVFDLDAAAATLLLDPDLELLRRAPVPPGGVLAIKLADAVPRTATPIVALALPAAFAFGAVFPLPAWGWLAATGAVAALWIAALGLGIALVLPALTVVPARRAREALGLVATFTITAIWLVNALWVPRLADEGAEPLSRVADAVARAAEALAWSPGHAAARLLWAAHAGDAAAAAAAGAALAASALAAALLAWRVARALLPRVLDAVAAPRLHARVARPRVGAARDVPRGLAAAVLARDRRLFVRDWTVLADVLTAAALWTLLPLVSRAVLETEGAALARAMLATLAVGLGYEIAARSIPFERRAVLWTRLAPVPPGAWLMAKLAGAALLAGPIVLVAWAILASALGLAPADAARALVFAAGALGLSLALGLWAGARFGDPAWVNPRAMLNLGGRLVAAGLMMSQISLWLVLGFMASLGRGALTGESLPWLAVGAALVLGGVALSATIRRLHRVEWRD
uniref:Uncharacterized protein n=1 Tax=Eiseniibacteriota bacterium TaxID=2212470 RepID=A0A832I345_UNCEI